MSCLSCFEACFTPPRRTCRKRSTGRLRFIEELDSPAGGPPRTLQAGFQRGGNVRVCAKVSPAGKHFEDVFEMTPQTLGRGMNGSVMLAHRRRARSDMDLEVSRSEDRGRLSAHSEPVCRRTMSPPPRGLEGDLVAVKTLSKRGLLPAQQKQLIQEVNIYLRMDHINVAKLLRVFDEADRVYLVMEYCPGGTLGERLNERGRFSEQEAAVAVRQILCAVNYCHRHPLGSICHRDLKPANFLYASKDHGAALKLVDFGLSRVLSNRRPWLTEAAGTLWFVAPEVLQNKKHDQSCDLWSVGVMAHCLLSGKAPFDAPTDRRLVRAVTEANLGTMSEENWRGVSPVAKDFVRSLMRVSPSERPDAATALRHPWLVPALDGLWPTKGLSEAREYARQVLEDVRQFARQSELRRAAAALVVYSEGLPLEETRRLEQVFQEMDTSLKGTVSEAELAKALGELGVPDEEGRWVFSRLDTDGDSKLHYSEFVTAALGAQMLRDEDTVRKAFSKLDRDQNGKVELREFREVLGREFCGKPCCEIFAELWGSGRLRGGIGLDEFTATVHKRIFSEVPPTSLPGALVARRAADDGYEGVTTSPSTCILAIDCTV